MNITVYPGVLSGEVCVPASKSMAHRLLIAAALADRPTRLHISSLNEDISATMDCIRALGASVRPEDGLILLEPVSAVSEGPVLDCGESGSTLRFLLPVAAALNARCVFTGRGRLPQRPNAALADAMRAHGAVIDSDLLPMRVSGGIAPGLWQLPGNVSSQYITGLLFALPLLAGDSEIRLTTPLESASYIDMTLSALRRFSVHAERTPTGWRVPGNQRYLSPGDIAVEGDWSAAAFWLAADRMGSDVRLTGLDPESVQGDRAVSALLEMDRADLGNTPDLAPILAVHAALRPGETVFTGVSRLRIKESDRLCAITRMLTALGASAEASGDRLVIRGVDSFTSATIDGVNDHRIVMAAAVAATRASGPVSITDCEAVAKSYPDFFRDLEKLGGRIHVQQHR